jgi:CubicO group peptidase (beta-lactamase class C family)
MLLRSRAGRDAESELDELDELNGPDGLDGVGAWLRERLPDLLAESRVPGAAVAVRVGDEVVEAAAGVLSTATGVEATVDSLFQIGSITEVMTATLVMQLVDEGELDLDAPVRTVLTEFRIADERAAQRITARHLLSHVAGFEGDIFTDTGKGDDCLAAGGGTSARSPCPSSPACRLTLARPST